MKKANGKLLSLGLVALLSACATPDHPLSRKDPFADPSKFESLASGPFTPPVTAEAPAPEVVSEVSPALATKPVPYTLIDGGSLFSAALPTADLSYPNRAPASVVFPKPTGDNPESALDQLVKGNERFVIGSAKGEHRDVSRRKELVVDQKPFAVVLSCSDSRVPPELIFDQGLGDLFTIRVAGNVLGSAQVASIEYAVEHLGAKLIVVMGHESCGAVKAAIDAGEGKKKIGESASPDMDWLVTSIRPVLKSRGLASVSPEDPKLRKPVMANIDAVTDNLVVRSKVIGDAIAKGNLKVVRGIYSLESGRVDFWGLK
jgi:carbonic anhydrase